MVYSLEFGKSGWDESIFNSGIHKTRNIEIGSTFKAKWGDNLQNTNTFYLLGISRINGYIFVECIDGEPHDNSLCDINGTQCYLKYEDNIYEHIPDVQKNMNKIFKYFMEEDDFKYYELSNVKSLIRKIRLKKILK